MTIRNRELSQFGSFIYVDNSSQEIGIATDTLPYVGIGTTNPQTKLHVVGDATFDGSANVGGSVSATSYYLNGNPLVNAAIEAWQTSGSDAYRLTGNVGIGTSVTTEKLTVLGNVSASRFISTVSTGTAPFTVNSTTEVANLNASLLRGGVPGQNVNSNDIVTRGDTQTLTNKTLIFPTFGGTGVAFTGSTSGFTILKASATAGSNNLTLPTTTGTLICSGDTGSVTSTMIADLNITNSDVSTTAGITYGKLNLSSSIVDADINSGANIAITKLAASTISGISLGNNLNNLTAGTYVSYDSGSTYNGGTARTISIKASSSNADPTNFPIVARNASGDFSAGTISVLGITATGTILASSLSATNALSASNGNFSGIITAVNGNFTGVVTALNGNFTSVTATNGNFSAGIVTALSFRGDGSLLTGVGGGSSITVTDETSSLNTHYVGFITETSGFTSSYYISSSKLTFTPSTGNLSATQFTSLSDASRKTNIRPIQNSIEITKQLSGVRFNWIDNNKESIGVIAQEVEKVLPELVETSEDGTKSVNYGNIVAVLIEAIKEQQLRIEELEKR